ALGGLVLGVVEAFVGGTGWSTYRDAIAFAVLILILLFKPAGMLGPLQVEKVQMWKMLARSQLILLGAILASFLVSLCSDRFDPYFVDVTIGIGINLILAVSLNL